MGLGGGGTGNYFRGAGEQAHTSGDFGSTTKSCEKNQGFGEIRALFLGIRGTQTSSPCGGLINAKMSNNCWHLNSQ